MSEAKLLWQGEVTVAAAPVRVRILDVPKNDALVLQTAHEGLLAGEVLWLEHEAAGPVAALAFAKAMRWLSEQSWKASSAQPQKVTLADHSDAVVRNLEERLAQARQENEKLSKELSELKKMVERRMHFEGELLYLHTGTFFVDPEHRVSVDLFHNSREAQLRVIVSK